MLANKKINNKYQDFTLIENDEEVCYISDELEAIIEDRVKLMKDGCYTEIADNKAHIKEINQKYL